MVVPTKATGARVTSTVTERPMHKAQHVAKAKVHASRTQQVPDETPVHRGIRNAQQRLKQTRQDSLTQTQLLNKSRFPIYNAQVNKTSPHTSRSARRAGAQTHHEQQEAQMTALREELQQIENEGGIAYEDEDTEMLTKNRPTMPVFPTIMLIVAVLKDFLDIPGELSIVGIIFTTALSFLMSVILFIWSLGKVSGANFKRKQIIRLWVKYGLAVLLEATPFAKMIPATTIFVLWTYFDEAKDVTKIHNALDKVLKLKF